MLQPVMRRTHPSWGFHSLLSSFLIRQTGASRVLTNPPDVLSINRHIEKICRHASARHEAHASFMGVPQSTECGFCWILFPSLGNSSSFSLKSSHAKISRHIFSLQFTSYIFHQANFPHVKNTCIYTITRHTFSLRFTCYPFTRKFTFFTLIL